jgi:hypothetical protein
VQNEEKVDVLVIFKRLNPSYSSSPELLITDNEWLRNVERKLETLQLIDKEKVLFATHQLEEPT